MTAPNKTIFPPGTLVEYIGALKGFWGMVISNPLPTQEFDDPENPRIRVYWINTRIVGGPDIGHLKKL
jgi:hypothetical protein